MFNLTLLHDVGWRALSFSRLSYCRIWFDQICLCMVDFRLAELHITYYITITWWSNNDITFTPKSSISVFYYILSTFELMLVDHFNPTQRQRTCFSKWHHIKAAFFITDISFDNDDENGFRWQENKISVLLKSYKVKKLNLAFTVIDKIQFDQ